MAFWDAALAQLRQLWGGLTSAQRVALVGVAVALAFGFGALLVWTGTPEYSVLFTRMAAEDAGGITERLRADGVPFRIADGGKTVLVPADRVYELRLSLAAEGIPAGGVVGYEIFDQTGFGLTNFAQKVNYARALEGELTRTVRRLDGVDGARVHLVLPERRLFEEAAEPATASVVLQLRSGRKLSPKQVQGLVYLVASSVEGLEPDRVTVVDTGGNVLYQTQGDEAGILATNQLEFKRAYEKDVEGRVRSMLERVLGSGAAVVQVSALFDFDRVEETSETFDPEAVAVRSEERQAETTTGPQGPQGVPGVTSNVGEGEPAPPPTGQGASSSRETETVNYEVSKKITRVQRTQGILVRQTVAVAVDGAYREGEGGAKEFVPRAGTELDQIRALVEKAVGFDQGRGDAVEVTSIPFRTAEPIAETRSLWSPELLVPLAKYALSGLLILILLLVVVRPFMRWLTQSRAPAEVAAPVTVAEMERRLEQGEEGFELEEKAPSETVKRETLKKRLSELVETEPDVAAQLIRSWIAEE